MELGHPDPPDQERACMEARHPTPMPSERPPPHAVLEPWCTETGLKTRTQCVDAKSLAMTCRRIELWPHFAHFNLNLYAPDPWTLL